MPAAVNTPSAVQRIQMSSGQNIRPRPRPARRRAGHRSGDSAVRARAGAAMAVDVMPEAWRAPCVNKEQPRPRRPRSDLSSAARNLANPAFRIARAGGAVRPAQCADQSAALVEMIVDKPRRRLVDARHLLEIGEAARGNRLGGAEGVQQRAFARRADARDLVERDLVKSFLRRARCVPMAKRCASSRRRCTK